MKNQCRLSIQFIHSVVMIAALLLAVLPASQVFASGCLPADVANQDQLIDALNCFNSETVPSTYTIDITGNLSLAAGHVPAISNSTVGVELIIDGNGFMVERAGGMEGSTNYAILDINPGTKVTLQNITIIYGHNYQGGGGIRNQGILTISNSILTENFASEAINFGPSAGGAIINYSSGMLTINNSTFSNNTATYGGGAIWNAGNSTITNSAFSGNSAPRGGAIYNYGGASLSITNSTFAENSSDSVSSGVHNGAGSTLTVTNSTFSNNTMTGFLTNATGGIYNEGTLTLNNSILANTSVGKADCFNSGTVNGSHNLIELDNSTGNACGTTDPIHADPNLGPLTDNGGFSQTMALLTGSLAIDAGDDTNCPAADQRGVTRPQYDSCDIGAYESAPPIELTITADDQTITYADTDPAFTFTYSGFQNGDDETNIETPPTCSVSGAHGDAGTYSITCSGAVDNEGIYTFTYVNGTLTVNKVTPALSVTNSPVSYNGSARSANVIGSVSGTVGNILYDGSATLPVDPGTYAVTADFVPNDTTNYVSLTNASAGNFVIEPALQATLKSIGSQDGWILESSENSNNGGTLNSTATLLYVGDNAQDKQYRSFLSFNTAGLPDSNITITSVKLKIKVQGFVGGNMFTPTKTLGNLLVDISESHFGTNANLAVADFQSAASGNAVGVLGSASTGWQTITLKSAAYDFVNLTGKTQFRLRFQKDDNNDLSADYLKIFSGEAPEASRPQLIVEYYVP